MAAEVSSMVKTGGGGGGGGDSSGSGGGSSSEINNLITRDLLGEFCEVRNNNKELDLKVSRMYLHFKQRDIRNPQRCNFINSPSQSSSSSSLDKTIEDQKEFLQPLKFMEESTSLELKLQPSSTTSSNQCQSVCTLDKVKFALRKAEKEAMITKKRGHCQSEEEAKDDEDDERKNISSTSSSSRMFAAACPGCLMYVMTMDTNPKCPRCSSTVPSPLLLLKKKKRARIDLNASL